MAIRINIPRFFQHVTNGVINAEVNGNTVGECLNDLVRQFPYLRERLFDKNGDLHHHIYVFVNTESKYPESLVRAVKDGDELDILVMLSGG